MLIGSNGLYTQKIKSSKKEQKKELTKNFLDFILQDGMEDWYKLSGRLKEREVKFIVEPYVRFKGEVGEKANIYFKDPSGNSLEFKAFKDLHQLFER